MSKMLFSLTRYFVCWIALFFIERLVFIGYFYSKLAPLSIRDFFSTFLYGSRMDASMAAYICALPLLFFILCWLIPAVKVPKLALKIYTAFLLVLCGTILASNLNIYQEWGTKLPYRAVSMLIEYPYEAYISASSSPFLVPFMILLGYVLLGWFLFRKVFALHATAPILSWYKKVPVSLLLIGILFLFIRSGIQTTPLNPSMAYFSTNQLLNHAAVNTEWNLLSDYLHNKGSDKNPFQVMEDREAQQLLAPYLRSSPSPERILTEPKPNVVLIMLESFTSDVVEGLGGEPGVAPHFEQLMKEGLTFPNIYASSDRTDKGMIAILSAFPSQATQSIIKNVNKQEQLPGIGQNFLRNGYHTSFVHGGESAFYNFRSYMLSHGIEKVIDQHDFPLKDVMSKWGAFDHLAFQKQLDYLNQSKQPFFSILLTLSNHEPFDLPTAPKFGDNSLANLFRSTAFYTDESLFNFLLEAKKTDWYAHTLFVIIADHGHRLPLEKWESFHPNRYKIPLLLYGDVLKEKYRGMKIDKIGGQTDLARTLLNQLDMDANDYPWSRDLLSPLTLPFGFFTWNNGFGVITPEQSLSVDNVGKIRLYLQNESVKDSLNQELEQLGKAYLQETYRQYLKY